MIDPLFAQGTARVAVVEFDSGVRLTRNFSQDETLIDADLSDLQPGDGGASILDAFSGRRRPVSRLRLCGASKKLRAVDARALGKTFLREDRDPRGADQPNNNSKRSQNGRSFPARRLFCRVQVPASRKLFSNPFPAANRHHRSGEGFGAFVTPLGCDFRPPRARFCALGGMVRLRPQEIRCNVARSL